MLDFRGGKQIAFNSVSMIFVCIFGNSCKSNTTVTLERSVTHATKDSWLIYYCKKVNILQSSTTNLFASSFI